MTKLYTQRDIVEQGEHYARHVDAMTAEGLHAKSDIAAELAHRDIEIERLTALVAELEEKRKQLKGDCASAHEARRRFESRADRLQKVVVAYAAHTPACGVIEARVRGNWNGLTDRQLCSCGLTRSMMELQA